MGTVIAIDYLPGFRVRELTTGIVRPVTNVEMMEFRLRSQEQFAAATMNETTCCGGVISDGGICSRFPGRTCVYLDMARALLQGN